MTAKLTLTDRPGEITVTDVGTVRAIAEAVTAFNVHGQDRRFRVRRPSPSQHIRRSTVFKASEVASLNADGVDLTDVGSPFQVEQVAA